MTAEGTFGEARVDGFRHEARLYSGEGEFVALAAAFVRAGLAAREPTLVVVSARKIDRVREELGGDCEGVLFADMAQVGRNPARIIPAWQDFVDRHAAPGVRLRGIGEPVSADREPDELAECQRHESLLNLAFRDAGPFWLLCPYDTASVAADAVAEARRSHPMVSLGADCHPSGQYHGLDAVTAPFGVPLPDAPADATELPIEPGTLDSLRRAVAERAAKAGLGMRRRIDFVVAVNEIATNSLKHGGGVGVMRLWHDARRLVCEVRDGGRIDDPLADRRLPGPDATHGRGLWMANQLCDLVQIRAFADGTVVRLHARTA